MKNRLLSTSLLLLLPMWWGGCEQSASGVRNSNPLAPSMDGAAKTNKPIRIQSGQLVYDPSESFVPLIDVKGTEGFRLSSTAEGSFGPLAYCRPCVPGDPIRLDSVSVGLDLRGTVTLHGKTYDRVGGAASSDPNLAIEFQGDGFIAPPFTDAATAELTAPFTFSGTFSYYPDGPSMPIVTETLTGTGIATVRLTKRTVAPDLTLWEVADAVFDFTK